MLEVLLTKSGERPRQGVYVEQAQLTDSSWVFACSRFWRAKRLEAQPRLPAWSSVSVVAVSVDGAIAAWAYRDELLQTYPVRPLHFFRCAVCIRTNPFREPASRMR